MSDHIKRVIYIYQNLSQGREYTSRELYRKLRDELDINVSERSVRRDLTDIKKIVNHNFVEILEEFSNNIGANLDQLYKNSHYF